MSPKVSKYENKHTIDYDGGGGGGDNENNKWGTCTEGTDKINLKKKHEKPIVQKHYKSVVTFLQHKLKVGL